MLNPIKFGTDWMVSPCSNCESIKADKEVCSHKCRPLRLFRKTLDTYLAVQHGHVDYQGEGYTFAF